MTPELTALTIADLILNDHKMIKANDTELSIGNS